MNAWVHTNTKPQISSTRSRGLGWRIHGSVEDTKLSTNKQHSLYHNANWTTAHEHVLQAFECICNDAGFATRRKQVLTSEGSRRADFEIRNIRLSDKVDLLVDITIRHDFIGAGRSGLNQGQLRNPDNPDHILERAA